LYTLIQKTLISFSAIIEFPDPYLKIASIFIFVTVQNA